MGSLVAVTREVRLFNTNIGLSEPEKVCTKADACPVLVREPRFQPGEAPVNGGGNYNPLKVAKFLVGQVPTCMNGVTIRALSQQRIR